MLHRIHDRLTLAFILTMAGNLTLAGESPMSSLQGNPTRVLESAHLTDMDALIERLADKRVIFVGEQHDRYADHLNQAAIIEGLLARGRSVAIGMEMFQQPYQPALDAYVAGEIDEAELLRRTQYFDRWRFDYRLYRPILRLARAHRIPVIALNLESELTRQVGDGGVASLSEADRARLPEIDRSDADHRARLEAIFKHHPAEQQRDFEHFLEVQLLWDEGMAERAARYLTEHPERTLVVISGDGHIEYGQGIPKRLARRVPVPMATLLDGQGRTPDPSAADFFLYPDPVELPPTGKLGVLLGQPAAEGGMTIDGFAEDSGAKTAGLQVGDRLVRVDGQPIASYADIRLALLDAEPNGKVEVEAIRSRRLGGDEQLTVEVELR
ncbi:ChaN family lipoprotein [Allochromatium humboldtianum]|uniref:ChaN family lipoprotein n=1 Tax=Allochromatium humboldtianum TaxID=504901 RepID=A0A850R2G0_9GAMM|nr:ChaN family lipoprotein [Allochromatium humboldtianum]NVZ07784.1 ChaN family lipoprotein [Allochromatium humboldtianum]